MKGINVGNCWYLHSHFWACCACTFILKSWSQNCDIEGGSRSRDTHFATPRQRGQGQIVAVDMKCLSGWRKLSELLRQFFKSLKGVSVARRCCNLSLPSLYQENIEAHTSLEDVINYNRAVLLFEMGIMLDRTAFPCRCSREAFFVFCALVPAYTFSCHGNVKLDVLTDRRSCSLRKHNSSALWRKKKRRNYKKKWDPGTDVS